MESTPLELEWAAFWQLDTASPGAFYRTRYRNCGERWVRAWATAQLNQHGERHELASLLDSLWGVLVPPLNFCHVLIYTSQTEGDTTRKQNARILFWHFCSSARTGTMRRVFQLPHVSLPDRSRSNNCFNFICSVTTVLTLQVRDPIRRVCHLLSTSSKHALPHWEDDHRPSAGHTP